MVFIPSGLIVTMPGIFRNCSTSGTGRVFSIFSDYYSEIAEGSLGNAIEMSDPEMEEMIKSAEESAREIDALISSKQTCRRLMEIVVYSQQYSKKDRRETLPVVFNVMLAGMKMKFEKQPDEDSARKIEIILKTKNLIDRNINPVNALEGMISGMAEWNTG